MDPHCVLLFIVEVIYDESQEDAYVAVKFVFYFVLGPVPSRNNYLPVMVRFIKHHLDPNLV